MLFLRLPCTLPPSPRPPPRKSDWTRTFVRPRVGNSPQAGVPTREVPPAPPPHPVSLQAPPQKHRVWPATSLPLPLGGVHLCFQRKLLCIGLGRRMPGALRKLRPLARATKRPLKNQE